MSRVCEICGKRPGTGNKVSHSHHRTKRAWQPNLQRVRAVIDGKSRRIMACCSCIKAGKVRKPGPALLPKEQ